MSTVPVKKCDLCDAFNAGDPPMFKRVGTADVCISCLHRLARAALLQLVTFSPSMNKAIDEEVERMDELGIGGGQR